MTDKETLSMKSFAAIDFETANRYHSSVCSVGVVVVRNGKVVDKLYRLIKPTPNFYTYWYTEVHGMTNAVTDNAKNFPEVWTEIATHIQGLPLVAHNSPFDESCLKAAFATYSMDYPDYHFYCTYRASRRLLGNKLPDHQLHTVAAYCGYDLTKHHHALADAEACAAIAIKLIDFK